MDRDLNVTYHLQARIPLAPSIPERIPAAISYIRVNGELFIDNFRRDVNLHFQKRSRLAILRTEQQTGKLVPENFCREHLFYQDISHMEVGSPSGYTIERVSRRHQDRMQPRINMRTGALELC